MFRFGMWNPVTTEQAFFDCNICECSLESVNTLRIHCQAGRHVRKALQRKKVQKIFSSTICICSLAKNS